ncbi:MAG TPA: translation elongation factor Ts [Gaiellaceae bacterium]|nr:translation elongation factor Ts [Gaiellaceae bacterium]
MTAISASLVKELREQTGAGMMDCKRALEESGGDVDAAKRLLREKGMAQAGKRADRSTPEGVVAYRIEGGTGTMVAVGCETEPVSKNEAFQAFAEQALAAVEQAGPEAVESLEAERQELVAKLGENIRVVGATRMEASGGETIVAYVHPPANKIGAIVRVRGGSEAGARDLAMHISFARPRFLTREQVPAAEVAAEREILAAQEDVLSKPENVREKIVEGRIQKWFADSVLLDQPWYREAGQTVAQAIGDVEVLDFAVYALAG